MGCCHSIDKKIPPPSLSKSSMSPPSPPPPLDEQEDEETVKEILLSETSIPKPFLLPKIHDVNIKSPPKQTLQEIQSPVKNNEVKKSSSINPIPTAEEFSEEVTEICSTVSETVSTKTFNEKPQIDVRQRSPAKYRNNRRSSSGELKREKVVGKSPGRGSNQSPGRMRSFSGRDPERKSGKSPIRVGSDLRSRSPANRNGGGDVSRNGVGRSPSMRKSVNSPNLVGSDLNRRGGEGGKWVDPTSTNESLENPLVSLECFIFL